MQNNLKHVKTAVIGMSFQFPEISCTADMEKLLYNGNYVGTSSQEERGRLLGIDNYKNIIGNVPLLSDIQYFDNDFFGVMKKEAEEMIPETKLSLTHSIRAIYDAGYSLEQVRGSDCGLIIASSSSDYKQMIRTGSSGAYLNARESMIGGRLSYYFDLRGPVFSVDSTCSSSLLAVIQAASLLESNQADMMLAGGTQILMPLSKSRAHELLLGGEKANWPYIPFDEKAAGFIPAEGVGFVVLKRYDDAVRDADHIYGIISGYGVSGTRAQRDTPVAPDGLSQSRAIKRAWASAGVTADDITEIEAHGASTELGDRNEVAGLAQCLSERTVADDVILSSVKSNLGHTSQAAGIAGLIKVLLGFKNNVAYPVAGFTTPDSRIDFASAHLNPVGRPVKFEAGRHRTAGIDSYGLNELNIHMVVENCVVTGSTSPELARENRFLKLSARTENSLKAYAAAIAGSLSDTSVNINDLIYTLNYSRDDMDFRSSVYFENIDELKEALAHISISRCDGKKAQTADISDVSEELKKKYAQEDPAKLAACMYADGFNIDFVKYYAGCTFSRISAVPYQFDKTLNWVTTEKCDEEKSPQAQTTLNTDALKDIIKTIWEQLLQVEIDYDDSFFMNGGNSLLAMLAAENINSELGTETGIQELYKYGTVNKMTAYINGLLNGVSIENSTCEKTTDTDPQEYKEIHDTIREVWQEALETDEDIADNESFFELGGNSMLAILIMESVADRIGVEIEMDDIYSCDTIEAMTKYVIEKLNS
ncbi:MAG: beta-ketoacyl synthase N-terminal-like domain-containing protein [Oscillospiraceae bacterium]|nr:beta-ketoacyl synthase N-terminal-like domain-containing protein [Oscillospiraceae bacterium]